MSMSYSPAETEIESDTELDSNTQKSRRLGADADEDKGEGVDADGGKTEKRRRVGAEDEEKGQGADADGKVKVIGKTEQTAIEYWSTRTSRLALIYRDTKFDRRFSWQLAGESHAGSLESQLEHCHACVQARLIRGYIKGFKIGITHLPTERMYNPRFGYRTFGFGEMILLAAHVDCDIIADLEKGLLVTYRRYNRADQCVNPHGHALCLNRAPGGESATHGFSPFFVYMVIKSTLLFD